MGSSGAGASRRASGPVPRGPPSGTRAIFSRVALHWGFVVRVMEASASQLALPVPPPTTVVGSLSGSLFSALGLKDTTERPAGRGAGVATLSAHFDCALGATLAAAAGLAPTEELMGICVHQEPSRLSAGLYKTGGSWAEALKSPFGSAGFYSKFIAEALPVQAVGAAYGPGVLLDLIWVFDVGRLVGCLNNYAQLGLSAGTVDSVGGVAAHGVSRLGSKEGIQSVEAAVYARENSIRVSHRGDIVATYLYAPVDCVGPIEPAAASRVSMWDLEYRLREYYLPAPSSNSLVVSVPPSRVPMYRIIADCSAFSIRISEEEEVTVVGRGVYGGLD